MFPFANDAASEPTGPDPEILVKLHTGDWVDLEVLIATMGILFMLNGEARQDLKLFFYLPKHELRESTRLLFQGAGLLDASGHLHVTVEQILEACAGEPYRPEWEVPFAVEEVSLAEDRSWTLYK